MPTEKPNVTMHYVTGVLIPRGFHGRPGELRRTDLAKFYEEAHAKAHLASIRGPGLYDLKVEAREERE